MDFRIEPRDRRLRLEGEMTIYSAAAMKEQMLSALAAADAPVELDLSQVSELDTAGLQIILMARRLAATSGRDFTVCSPSAAAADALSLCGLSDLVRRDAGDGS